MRNEFLLLDVWMFEECNLGRVIKCSCIFFQDSSENVIEFCGAIKWTNHCFHVKHHYSGNNLREDHMQKVLVPSFLCVWNRMPGKMYEYYCCFEILGLYCFNDLMNCENLWGFSAIPLKAVLIFPKNFLDFELDTVENQGIINLSSYSG